MRRILKIRGRWLERRAKKELKVSRFEKFGLWVIMTALVLSLSHISLAQVLLIAPSKISLGSVKPGDTVETKRRLLVKFSEAINVEKVGVSPAEEEEEEKEFILKLEGESGIEISASYICKKVFWNKEAGIIHVEVTIKVSEIKWEYAAGEYSGEIIITFSESDDWY